MEELFRIIVLGIVQGLTEFLPISSSGHLILVRELFGWEFSNDLTFDLALHLGTTVAVLAFFWREWLLMLGSSLSWATSGGREHGSDPVFNHGLLLLLVIGSVPAALVGFLFGDYIEEHIRSPVVVGVMLMVFGGVLFLAERLGRGRRDLASSTWRDAVWIGCAQAVSLIPGVSRSGVTISAALARDYTRYDAARFSFFLATPVIVGAGGLKMLEALNEGISRNDLGLMLVGAVVAAVTGWLVIGFLLRYVQARSYLPFVIYRLVVGVFVIVYFAR
ncbi:MAG: undecaprenyl-diphosphatase UppP [Dehalococcoidia bacterium]